MMMMMMTMMVMMMMMMMMVIDDDDYDDDDDDDDDDDETLPNRRHMSASKPDPTTSLEWCVGRRPRLRFLLFAGWQVASLT